MWEANPDVLVTDLGDELVLLNPASGVMFSLNETGRLAWLALPDTEEMLGGVLTGAHEIPLEVALQDIRGLLSDLQARGLVRRPL
ncbi:PqqD family protein [Deinococcus hohokamensis]|uniref:PqqD family protein n=1 Tax=Deinococcus hohokamensis TaxID=309883 RepID=A0ABV9IAX2_9DEIO